jgi:hypothetical protein
MADLSSIEKMKIEKLFDMGTGYVIDFSNRTFYEFILENTGIKIYDSKYDYESGSKANHLRAFWKKESNQVVGQLLLKLLEYWMVKREISYSQITPAEQTLYDECMRIADRLAPDNPTEHLSEIQEKPMSNDNELDVYINNSYPDNTVNSKRNLRVFLCHSSSDKPVIEKFYDILVNDGIDAWLDKKNLFPGQDWQVEIPKAVRNSDVVIVFLSSLSVNKEGFVQKEIKIALDTADEKLEGTIFIIPAKLEICEVPERLAKFQWVDLFEEDGYERLFKALQLRAHNLGIVINRKANRHPNQLQLSRSNANIGQNLFRDVRKLFNLSFDSDNIARFYRPFKKLGVIFKNSGTSVSGEEAIWKEIGGSTIEQSVEHDIDKQNIDHEVIFKTLRISSEQVGWERWQFKIRLEVVNNTLNQSVVLADMHAIVYEKVPVSPEGGGSWVETIQEIWLMQDNTIWKGARSYPLDPGKGYEIVLVLEMGSAKDHPTRTLDTGKTVFGLLLDYFVPTGTQMRVKPSDYIYTFSYRGAGDSGDFKAIDFEEIEYLKTLGQTDRKIKADARKLETYFEYHKSLSSLVPKP